MILKVLLPVALSAGLATAAFAATGEKPHKPKQASWSCSISGTPTPNPSTHTPSEKLLDTLPVLRRPRTPADAVPADTLPPLPTAGPMMLDAARQLRPHVWLVPEENVDAFPALPQRCVDTMSAKQRAAYEKAQRDAAAQPPVEGVTLLSENGQNLFGQWSTDAVASGRTFSVEGCAGAKRDQLQVSGLAPGQVDQVRITAKDGSITDAPVTANLVQAMFERPTTTAGLPAHVTIGSTTIDLIDNQGLIGPCNPPQVSGQGQRLAKPIHLSNGAVIELATHRWEAEDKLPVLDSATIRTANDRCLMLGSRAQLERKLPKQRYCVSDAQIKASTYVAKVVTLANGDRVLEGFADPAKVTWITVEKEPGGGASAVWPGKESGAFFLAVRHGVSGRTFELHAALRGKPVRYTKLRTISG